MGVYVALPSLRNLPGKIVLSNVIAVTAATIMILVNYNVVSLQVGPTSCKIVGHLVYYFGIAMFTWMTIMCFDLCTIFLKDMATPHKGILNSIISHPTIIFICNKNLPKISLYCLIYCQGQVTNDSSFTRYLDGFYRSE